MRRLYCWKSPVRSRNECLRNLRTLCIIGSRWVSRLISTLVTGIVRIQSVNTRWKSSSMLMEAMMVSSSGTDCELMRHDKESAWPNSVVWWYCMSKLYPNEMIAQCCSRLAEYIGIPFFEPNIDSNGLWSGMWSGARVRSCENCSRQKSVLVLPFFYLTIIAFSGCQGPGCMHGSLFWFVS